MSAFPDWKRYAVCQRRPRTGCIPTGYEMILRAARVEGINFNTFQDDFDLDKDLQPGQQPRNNFVSVADAIQQKYPHVKFKSECFQQGTDKLKFIEEGITQQQPVLVSLAIENSDGKKYHIMPVVDATNEELGLLRMKQDGSKDICWLRKTELVCIHDSYKGGKDVAYLDIE